MNYKVIASCQTQFFNTMFSGFNRVISLENIPEGKLKCYLRLVPIEGAPISFPVIHFKPSTHTFTARFLDSSTEKGINIPITIINSNGGFIVSSTDQRWLLQGIPGDLFLSPPVNKLLVSSIDSPSIEVSFLDRINDKRGKGKRNPEEIFNPLITKILPFL